VVERLLSFSLAQRFLVIVAAVMLAVVGAISWQQLTLDAVPDVTPNQVQINTDTGGLSPLEVERLVTFPVETAMGGVPGRQSVRSLSQYGLSQVTVTFDDATDVYFARQLVNERLNNVREQLPAGVDAPQLGPVSTGLGEVYMYALESDTRSIMDLRTLQDWTIAPQLRTVPGVAEVSPADGSERQYQVVLDPQRLRARNLSVAGVVEALEKNNRNAGGGVLERQGERTLIRSVGLATKPSDIETIVVASEGGVPVLMRDVGEVRLGTQVLTGVSSVDGRHALVSTVLMLKGANGRTVAQDAAARLKEVAGQLPPDVRVRTLYNRADLVNQAVHTVQKSLLEGGVLVVVILLALLGNVRGALIVALAIPLSMLFAIALMNRFGISGNLMSLGAIDFGLIVDGAVVMIENAVRRLAEQREHAGRTLTREEVRATVSASCREVAKPTAFAVTIITVVYLPILALEGTEGKMFKPMAFTVVFALIGALVLTLTLIPALASLFLSGDTKEGRNPIMGMFDRLYRPVLGWAMRSRAIVVGGALGLLALSTAAFTRLGSEFIPTLDEGSSLIQPVRLRTVDAEETLRLVTAMERKIKEVPEVTTVFSRTGTAEVATDPMPLSLGDSFIMLKPREEWRRGLTKPELIEEMERKAKEVPGQGYGFSQPIQMRFSELVSGVKADVAVKVFGEDLDELKRLADGVAAVLRKVPGAADVQVEQVDDVPVLQIDIDRLAIARLGVNVDDVQTLVSTALGRAPVGQIIEGDKRSPLVVRFATDVSNSAEGIAGLPVPTPGGSSVPLGSVARIANKPAPAQISREAGKRRVVVQLNVRGSDLGSFIGAAQSAIARDVRMPEGYYLTWGGQFENLQRASARLTVVVPVALGLIFVLLFTTFGSVRQALLIFTGVPLAVTGGILALWARGLPFSIAAGVGFIALSGVAVLNGVVMVSAINRLREEQALSVKEAARQGALERLRPVLMTALVAALGFIPMALNTGIGAEVQKPLATVVIGGIASATLLTLLVLPTLYAWFEKDRAREVEV